MLVNKELDYPLDILSKRVDQLLRDAEPIMTAIIDITFEELYHNYDRSRDLTMGNLSPESKERFRQEMMQYVMQKMNAVLKPEIFGKFIREDLQCSPETTSLLISYAKWKRFLEPSSNKKQQKTKMAKKSSKKSEPFPDYTSNKNDRT